MKLSGIFSLVAGLAICFYAFNLDTTVEVKAPESYMGYKINVPKRVENLQLANEKQNKLMLGGILSIVGTILFVASQKNKEPDPITYKEIDCPHCNTTLDLDDQEMRSGNCICPECNKQIEFVT